MRDQTGSAGTADQTLRRSAAGPGGYYNAGNLLGLIVALVTQFAVATQAGASRGGLDILVGYFVGSPSAVTLTVATIVFLISGEVYHRAWAAGRGAADPALNQIADVLSAIGATALTVSLMFLGQWLLALASGLLIVGGKLGSALLCDDRARLGFWPAAWVDPFRGAVLAGRLPGIAATGIDLGFRVLHWNDGSVALLVQPAVLIVCYLLWIKADLLLVMGTGTANQIEEANDARTQ